MAVTLNDPTLLDFGISFSWTSSLGGTPTFYIYIAGLLVETTTGTTYNHFGDPSDVVHIEVFDVAPPHTPVVIPSGNERLCWYEQSSVAEWKIEEKIAGTWAEIAILTDSDSWFYEYVTRYLEDASIHHFRVTPIAQGDYMGDALMFSFLIARFPDPPDVTYTYAAGTKKVTIAAA